MADRLSPFLFASVCAHVIALLIIVVAPHWWPFLLAAVIANHLTIVGASLLPRCAWLGRNIRRIPDDRARSEWIALTFDDGPNPEITPAVLDLLDTAGVKATFFCLGRNAEKHPDLIAAIRERGHDVANHTYSHPNLFALKGPRGMQREIVAAQEAIARSGGGQPSLFRAPAGIQNPWLFPLLSRHKLTLVSWTRRGFDTVTSDSMRVADRLLRNLRAGDILLLHDGNPARDASGRPVVLDALARVLATMAKKGLRSERLSVLVGSGG